MGPTRLSFSKTSSPSQLVHLSVLIRPPSQLDDHSPAPPVSPPPVLFGGHRQRALENLALRQQLSVYKRTTTPPKLPAMDRLFWVWLTKVWAGWRQSVVVVTPDTVLRWQRRRFRHYWTQLSGRPTGGRPPVNAEIKGSHHSHGHREPPLILHPSRVAGQERRSCPAQETKSRWKRRRGGQA
jgi:hypothetical protein